MPPAPDCRLGTRHLTAPLPLSLPTAHRTTSTARTLTLTRTDRRPEQPHRHTRNDLILQLVEIKHKLPALATPVIRLEEDVDGALLALADGARGQADRHALRQVDERERGVGVGFLGVFLEPLAQDLVPAPLPAVELVRGEFLQDVARVLVEDGEERFWG